MLHVYYILKEKYQSNIRINILILLVAFILIPTLTLQTANVITTSTVTHHQNQAILDENLKQSTMLLNARVSAYKDVYFNISTDTAFLKSLDQLNRTSPDTMIYRRIKDTMDTVVMSKILLYPEIQGVGVIAPNQVSYFYSQKREKYQYLSDYFTNHYLKLHEQLGTSPKCTAGSINASDNSLQQSVFYLGGGIIHYEKLNITGTLILFIDASNLNQILNDEDSKIYPYTSRVLFLQDGSIICDKNQNWGKKISDIPEYTKPSRQINRTEITTDKLNMTIYNFIDYSRQNRNLVLLWTLFALLTLLFICLLMFILYIMIGKQIIHPIEHIAQTMDKSTTNQLGPPLTDIRKNEIGKIEKSYNRMISNIEHLLTENELQMQKTYEAELKSLELQINPHFIFNTLDTINWTAVQEGAMDVSEMLTGLAAILRYTVYGINQVIPLKSDIDWIHQYLELQKIRFHNKFSYDLFIQDSSIYQLRIHKLLLEPILENSLVHGFDGLNQNCHIEIRYQILQNQFLKITITDNGKGMSEENLQSLRSMLSSPDWYRIETAKSIGLLNVMCRIHTYYKGSKIIISSKHHITCCKLFIPLSEME